MNEDQHDHEMTYPHESGDFTILGPEVFTSPDRLVISWKGSNFYRACNTLVRKLPDGSSNFCIRQAGHEDNNHVDYTGHCTQELTYIGGSDEPASCALIMPPEEGVKGNDGYSQDTDKFNPNGEVVATLSVSCTREAVGEAMDVLLSPLAQLAKKEGTSVSLSLYDSRDY